MSTYIQFDSFPFRVVLRLYYCSTRATDPMSPAQSEQHARNFHSKGLTSSQCYRFWFAVNDPEKYKDIYNVKDVYQYYQKFVGDYEEVMRGWGYCVPEVTGDAMEKHVDAKVRTWSSLNTRIY